MQNQFVFSDRFSAFFWMVDTLYPCFDDDMNNDVNSLYVEIIDKNRNRMHDLWPTVVEER